MAGLKLMLLPFIFHKLGFNFKLKIGFEVSIENGRLYEVLALYYRVGFHLKAV